MKMRRLLILLGAICFFTTIAGQEKTLPQLGVEPVGDVVAAMTLDEKLNIIRGIGMNVPGMGGPVAGKVEGKVPGAAGNTHDVLRLGIPSIVLADGPAGLRIDSVRKEDGERYYATAFPIATSLASTWNTDLVEKVGQAMGNEVLEYGVDVLLAPGMNMQRNPLGGRNFEYYSEDPLLTGKIASAMVNGIQSNGVGACLKHFAVNDQETNRFNIDAIIGERALREIYLKPFQIAVKEANPWTVMSSYNKVNGTYASESYELLTTTLREEWGFDGLVMTDWFAGKDYAGQVKAGNDLLMPGRKMEVRKIKYALEEERLTEAELDRNIEKILNVVKRTPSFRNYQYSDSPDLKSHAKIARQAGAEGMILLKNMDSSLPIKSKRIALLGNASYDLFVGGTGSGEVHEAYNISLYQGLIEAGYELNENLKKDYESFISKKKAERPPRNGILDLIKPIAEKSFERDQLERIAIENDLAVITIGRNGGEHHDRKVKNDFLFTQEELSLIKITSEIFHDKGKKVVVVLNIDAIVDVAQWRDWVDGIVIAWQPGQEAGNAIADVLSGKVNPSGRLTSTIPMKYSDVPSSESFPGEPEKRPTKTIYNEGIYVGYRYYQTFNVKPAYEFGYGLSYTNFKIKRLKMQGQLYGNGLIFSVKVKNTGDAAGKEVVQLYITATGNTLAKPESELKAFAKTRLLQPGESQRLTFTITPRELASFDPSRNAWITEAGDYSVKIGKSCDDIKLTKIFFLANEIVIEKVNNALVPIVDIEEFKK
jgi:beta-glucosidase